MFSKRSRKDVDFAVEISTVDPLPPPDNFPTFDEGAPPPQRCVPHPNLLLIIYESGSILNSQKLESGSRIIDIMTERKKL